MSFDSKLISSGPKGAWTFMDVPFNVHEVFGTKGRVPVAGTMNGFPFRNSIMPEGDGTHRMMVGKELRAGAKAQAGDIVKVTLERDEKERTVEVPSELVSALKKHKTAGTFFASLTASQKKEYADWISSAKQAETKASRVEKAIDFLIEGKKRLR
jgi:hypothetical protein